MSHSSYDSSFSSTVCVSQRTRIFTSHKRNYFGNDRIHCTHNILTNVQSKYLGSFVKNDFNSMRRMAMQCRLHSVSIQCQSDAIQWNPSKNPNFRFTTTTTITRELSSLYSLRATISQVSVKCESHARTHTLNSLAARGASVFVCTTVCLLVWCVLQASTLYIMYSTQLIWLCLRHTRKERMMCRQTKKMGKKKNSCQLT